MFILRMKTDKNVTTFVFNSKEEAINAADYVMKTSAAGFIGEVKTSDAKKGIVVKTWDHGSKWGRSSRYCIQHGAYKDSISAEIGTEEECHAKMKETNARIQCWADTHVHVERLVGSLWQVVYTSPFTD